VCETCKGGGGGGAGISACAGEKVRNRGAGVGRGRRGRERVVRHWPWRGEHTVHLQAKESSRELLDQFPPTHVPFAILNHDVLLCKTSTV
jgi:hypothetical protein